MYPVPLSGQQALATRIEQQKEMRKHHAQYLSVSFRIEFKLTRIQGLPMLMERKNPCAVIQDTITQVSNSSIEIQQILSPRSSHLSHQHEQIISHLIKYFAYVAQLSTLLRGSDLESVEEGFHELLGKVDKMLNGDLGSGAGGGGGGSGGLRLQGRIAGDWERVIALREDIENGRVSRVREEVTSFLQEETLVQVSVLCSSRSREFILSQGVVLSKLTVLNVLSLRFLADAIRPLMAKHKK